MKNHKTGIKSSLVCFSFILFLLSISTSVLVKGSDSIQDKTVKIGQWTISGYAFDVLDNPGWSGTASADNKSHISIYIYKDPNRDTFRYNPERNEKFINIDGIGEVLFNTFETGAMQQSLPNTNVVDMQHSLSCIFNQQRFTFVRSERHTREPGSVGTREQFVKECIQKVLKEAPSDTLVSFAKRFFSKNIKLDQNLTSTTIPVIEASINNGEYIELKTSQSRKGAYSRIGDYNFGWILPAQLGENVKFRIQLDTCEMIASTYGITTRNGREFSQGRKISIDDKEFIFNGSGIAELNYENIKDTKWLSLRYLGWKASNTTFKGYFYLRWGRSEEKWLDNNEFPLADKIKNPTLDNCINSLLHDLNIAYDWDRNCWITYRGEQRKEYYPDYSDFSSLEGFVLDDFPQLSTLNQDKAVNKWLKSQFSNIFWKPQYNVTGEVTIDDVNLIQSDLVKLNLDNQMASYFDDGPSSWSHPFEVVMLSYLWKEFPEFRQGNPIEKILDFWVEVMKENPDPVRDGGKAGAEIDDRLVSRAYAIATLNLGYELFKKQEYKEACDVQISRFREYLQEKGILNSIIKLEGWEDKTFGFTDDRDREMCEAVSLYGQVCALIGDKEGLKQTQDWIKSALKRDETQGQNPFRNYESATFKDRCGFIAVLRGKSTFSELPLKKNVLLN